MADHTPAFNDLKCISKIRVDLKEDRAPPDNIMFYTCVDDVNAVLINDTIELTGELICYIKINHSAILLPENGHLLLTYMSPSGFPSVRLCPLNKSWLITTGVAALLDMSF